MVIRGYAALTTVYGGRGEIVRFWCSTNLLLWVTPTGEIGGCNSLDMSGRYNPFCHHDNLTY